MINRINPAFTGSVTVVNRGQNRTGEQLSDRITYSTNGLKFMRDGEDPESTYVSSPGSFEADRYECPIYKFEEAFLLADSKNQNVVIDLTTSKDARDGMGILG